MGKELEKKVDDYYSNINSSDKSDSPSNKSKVKGKIKPKLKKVVKKVKKDETKEDLKKSVSKEDKLNKEDNKKVVKKKKVITNSFADVEVKDIKKEEKGKKTKKEVSKKEKKKTDIKENNKKKVESLSDQVGVARGSGKKKQYKKFSDDKTGNNNFSKNSYKGKKSKGNFKKGGKSFYEEEEEIFFTRSNKMKNVKKDKEDKKIEDIKQNLVDHSGETVVIPEVLTLKEFSEKIGVPLPNLMAEFMKNGMMLTLNSKVDFDTAAIIAEAFNIKLEKDVSGGISVEDIISGNLSELIKEEDTSKLIKRAPIISIMGHVDHGKTSLLDSIRNAKIANSEAGGITQSIGAYQVEQNGEKITFLDTPGHEAFTVMRARGAKSTDIAILVVAADEGVKPQTIESINHAKEANIPIIVAINKMDKEGANPDHVMGQLAEHGLTPEAWGGDTPMIPVSAKTGQGVDDLLEMILLVAEMQELKANPNRNGVATVIESHLDNKLGPVSTVLINTGEIKIGDAIVCKNAFGKVKVLKDYNYKNIKKAGPSEPVMVIGLDKIVEGGDLLQVVSGIDVARAKAIEFEEIMKAKSRNSSSGLELLMSKINSGNLKTLKIVVKADTNGSLEAIKGGLQKLSTADTTVSIIHSGVGNVTESDILMCEGSSAILVSFNTGVVSSAKSILEKSGIEYISSKIIYHITERIEKIVSGMLDPKEVEVILCNAEVGGIFFNDKKFMILGLKIKKEGEIIENNTFVRVIRKNKVVGKGKIESLKQGVEEVKKLEGPIECGVKFVGDVKVEEKDILEIYKIEIQK